MQWVRVDVGEPGPGEAQVRHEACGLNYIDVYFRDGTYAQPLPGGIGLEAAGVVVAVGTGVTHIAVGDRVAYTGRPLGAYATERVIPASILLKLPDSIDFETAAAMMLQGLTVDYLFNSSVPLRGGETILFHAAAGGVGLIACQWARALGVTVIGTASTADKLALARAHGCEHTINYRSENVVERVREITGGRGVPVVYDGVGKDTFTMSLDCLARFGTLVSFGNASGVVPPFSLSELASRGSLYVQRPTLFHYMEQRSDLEAMASRLFGVVGSGKVTPRIGQRYALRDAAQAHRDLEARKTTGSTLLLP
jgi:NADPH2:quinone reductase